MRRNTLLLLTAISSTCYSLPSTLTSDNPLVAELISPANAAQEYPNSPVNPLSEIKMMLQEAPVLNEAVINKVLTALKCTAHYNVEYNNILTIIDYSLPSSKKRLWVFDLKEKKLLFHTYVSHGITSGFLISNYFSNKYNSKASSIGIYKTEKAYYGREGLSLRLDGLDRGFNDNASGRYVVMHGGWYVDENFIKKYGRAGRSWGCPALPLNLTESIINTIKDKSLFVVYYPNDNWFVKSKFLNCEKLSPAINITGLETETPSPVDNNVREEVLFANITQKNKTVEPILVIAADAYERIFHTKAPLTRMLRRQINNVEYIALSNTELENIALGNNKENLSSVYFVIPFIKRHYGHYATEMKIIDLGKIKNIRLIANSTEKISPAKNYIIDFEEKPSIQLKPTHQFIRWLGL
ncbi:murein L,D-transpeptidase catalytic domain family protein [Legionella fairfieldensis]|uniref:murein L,D-transpeptidase catalytic domain family protein n=1 Tax=Legionella fairfieldensis TaxID=45064 RepID=UPI00048FCA05|nr:murein L,D-transpeptidase catalytic domain family protein [Legionella fairfieldensis]